MDPSSLEVEPLTVHYYHGKNGSVLRREKDILELLVQDFAKKLQADLISAKQQSSHKKPEGEIQC
jgi:hypothetical protein